MKKLLFILSAVLLSISAFAQSASKAQYLAPHPAKLTVTGISPKVALNKVNTAKSHIANKTTAARSRWYNHALAAAAYNYSGSYTFNAENVDSEYYLSFAGLYPIWPDSTIRYPAPDDIHGISYLSLAQMFHPGASAYNDPAIYPSAVAAGDVITFQPYTVDSVSVLGRYVQVDPSLVDTLIFTFTYEQNNMDGNFHYLYYNYSYGSVFADHGVDSFAAVLWNDSDYMTSPINQCVYQTGTDTNMGYMQIKVPLNNSIAADTITSGILAGLQYLSVAPGILMADSSMVSVSVTYKPNYLGTYIPGVSYDQYNHFEFLSHEPDTGTGVGGFEQYEPYDFNMSYVVYKDSMYTNVSSGLNIYTPSIAFTAPYKPEEHDISFKVSFNDTAHWYPNYGQAAIANIPTGIGNIKAYPNPANTILNIPVSLAQSGNVSVTITNAAGQAVMSQDLGTVPAGITRTATFGISPLASGTYFYTVTAGLQTVTNRITIAH